MGLKYTLKLFSMLAESLKVAHHVLKEEMNKDDADAQVNYPDEVHLEVQEIMQRIETLQFKLDCPLWSNGYKYEDGVTWEA